MGSFIPDTDKPYLIINWSSGDIINWASTLEIAQRIAENAAWHNGSDFRIFATREVARTVSNAFEWKML